MNNEGKVGGCWVGNNDEREGVLGVGLVWLMRNVSVGGVLEKRFLLVELGN